MSDLAACPRAFAEAIGARPAPQLAAALCHHAATERAVDALAEHFSIVARILGSEPFYDLAGDFVVDHPPDGPVLTGYGSVFPEWVEHRKIGQILPYLAAVAQIDRLHAEADRAPSDTPLGRALIAALTADQWSRSKAKLHPATRFGWFAVPGPSIWLTHFDPRMAEVAPAWAAEGILITRPGDCVEARRIGPAEHRILSGLRIGETIGAAASAAHALYPDADITRAFDDIVDSGALASLKARR